MKAVILALVLLAIPSTAQAHPWHTCKPVAANERTVATNVACWYAGELALGAREQLSNVHWHGQTFKLYRFTCKALNTFDSNGSGTTYTWHFNCERGHKFVNFEWRFRQ